MTEQTRKLVDRMTTAIEALLVTATLAAAAFAAGALVSSALHWIAR